VLRRLLALVLTVLVALGPFGALAGEAAAQGVDAPSGAVRLDGGRFTIVAYPGDVPLARTLLARAVAQDSFPGLPRPTARIVIAVAPDQRRFREWGGPGAPEWGAAFAFPGSNRIVMQGRGAGSDAGDPIQVLRHELAHLALHEYLGDLPPRWFDEGYASYAAGEWGRDDALATNVALLVRGMPGLDELDEGFEHASGSATEAYALAYRAVADLASLDPQRGLSLFFVYWKQTGRFDLSVRQAYGITAGSFEALWQQRTRRRYGVLAFVTNFSLVTGALGLVMIPLWRARRRRDRARLEAMRRADEAAERVARESALAALLEEGHGRPAPPA